MNSHVKRKTKNTVILPMKIGKDAYAKQEKYFC